MELGGVWPILFRSFCFNDSDPFVTRSSVLLCCVGVVAGFFPLLFCGDIGEFFWSHHVVLQRSFPWKDCPSEPRFGPAWKQEAYHGTYRKNWSFLMIGGWMVAACTSFWLKLESRSNVYAIPYAPWNWNIYLTFTINFSYSRRFQYSSPMEHMGIWFIEENSHRKQNLKVKWSAEQFVSG